MASASPQIFQSHITCATQKKHYDLTHKYHPGYLSQKFQKNSKFLLDKFVSIGYNNEADFSKSESSEYMAA